MTPRPNRTLLLVVALGITQTIGYGTIYYAYGVMAPLMAADTGWSLTAVFGIFSAALLGGGIAAPFAGRAMDRFDPARMMAAGSLATALALVLWAQMPGRIAFAIFGVSVQMLSVLVLYEAAFVTAARIAPHKARRVITGITLIAGFASTIFWPFTTWLSQFLSWREVYLIFGLLNLAICAPLHWWLGGMRIAGEPDEDGRPAHAHVEHGTITGDGPRRAAFLILLLAFCANAYVISAVHLHLIGMLGALGLGASAALIGAIIGPAQVAGRIIEFSLGERISVVTVAVASAAALPAGLLVLMAGGGLLWSGIAFAVAFGLGQGLSYIVRGVLPLHVFGTKGYGALMGKFNSGRLLVSAAAPVTTAAIFEQAGVYWALAAILAVAVLGVAALVAVIPLRSRSPA